MTDFTFYTHQTVSKDDDGHLLEHWLIEKKYQGSNTKFAKVSYLVIDGKLVHGDAHIHNEGKEKEYKLDGKRSLLKVMKLVKKLQ